jgi:P4 family phage/plasmid primase-like protien
MPDRPHRYSTVEIPEVLPQDVDIFDIYKDEIDAIELNQQRAVQSPVTSFAHGAECNGVRESVKKLTAFLDHKKLKYRVIDKPAMVVIAFEECPYHKGNKADKYECCLTVAKTESKKGDGTVIQTGAWGADCKHEAAAGWKEFKDVLGWAEYASALRSAENSNADDSKLTMLEITNLFLTSQGPCRLVYLNGVFYQWNGRSYQEALPAIMEGVIMGFLQGNGRIVGENQTKASTVREVIANMKGRCFAKDIAINSFMSGSQQPGNYVAVTNGILALDVAIQGTPEDALLPATSDFYSLVCLPYAYDPTAPCPVWMRFLDEVVPDAATQTFLQEWFGYNLTTRLCYETFVILEGQGANGKSVILKVLRALLGPENVSCVPLELFEKPFNRYELYGKLANIVTEMSECEKVAEEILKAIVSGDPIQFERKHMDAFSASSTVKLTFATNILPPIRDRTSAIWRRMVIIPFLMTIPVERQDKGLAERLISSELSGILNWAIAGLKRLKERGRFEVSEICQAASKEYQTESNSVRRFVEQECVENVESEILTQSLYQAYKRFCSSTGARELGDVQFGKEIRKVCPKVTKVGKGSGRGKAYRGIQLAEDGEFSIDPAVCMEKVQGFTPIYR